MTKTEIAEVIYDACRVFDTNLMISGNIPYEEVSEERIVIIPGRIQDGRYWNECIVKVNWCVPNIDGEADAIRIKEVQKKMEILHYGIGTYNGTLYKYKKDSTDEGEDSNLRCHFANLTLIFKIQNIK